jgi:hypothetical protein
VYICTSDLPDKKQCCQLIDGNVRLLFRHWTSSVAVSVLCFQLAAGQNTLTAALQLFQNTINSNTASLQTLATAGIQELQAAADDTMKNIITQIQAAMNSSQQYASLLNISSQAQNCLIRKERQLAAIANASRK